MLRMPDLMFQKLKIIWPAGKKGRKFWLNSNALVYYEYPGFHEHYLLLQDQNAI